MFNFFEKLVTIILPRVRHFNAIDLNLFDGKGNLSLGLSPILIVPELESYFEYFECIRGINISLITNASFKKKKSFSQSELFKNYYLKSPTFSLLQNNKQINKKAGLLLSGFQLPVVEKKVKNL